MTMAPTPRPIAAWYYARHSTGNALKEPEPVAIIALSEDGTTYQAIDEDGRTIWAEYNQIAIIDDEVMRATGHARDMMGS